jgi:hypothetical protein
MRSRRSAFTNSLDTAMTSHGPLVRDGHFYTSNQLNLSDGSIKKCALCGALTAERAELGTCRKARRTGRWRRIRTTESDRARLAKQAIHKLARGTDAAHSVPAPNGKVRAPAGKKRNEIKSTFQRWCGRGDSNPHPFREQIFVPLRLSPPP